MLGLVIAAICGSVACEPTVIVGQWNCPASLDGGTVDASAVQGAGDPISIPWSTGFEHGFCDYALAGGFCTQPVQYNIVSAPTKSGHSAAAFTVDGEDGGAQQSRCVRQGVLPAEAYYGAWYYIPVAANNAALWNLFHIQGDDPANSKGIVDVSLASAPNGALNLVLFLFLHGPAKNASVVVPIGSWFHIELYLKRANDSTGAVILYQDGVRVLDITAMSTDPAATSSGQWYVGNLADGLTPPESTIYVDDVTIAATLGYTPPP